MITYWLSVVVIGVNISAGIVYANNYPLTVIHTNDIHSRIEETNKYCGVCKPEMKSKCFLKSILFNTGIKIIVVKKVNLYY